MRTIDYSKEQVEAVKKNSTDLAEMIIVRELQNLAGKPELNSKDIISLERLVSVLLKKKAGDREETLLLSKLNGNKALPELDQEQLKALLEGLTNE